MTTADLVHVGAIRARAAGVALAFAFALAFAIAAQGCAPRAPGEPRAPGDSPRAPEVTQNAAKGAPIRHSKRAPRAPRPRRSPCAPRATRHAGCYSSLP